jgi:hypothetical protein
MKAPRPSLAKGVLVMACFFFCCCLFVTAWPVLRQSFYFGPHLVTDEYVFDFGEKAAGEVVEHVFKIRNDGWSDVIIEDLRPDCSCVVAKQADTVIHPGASMEVPVRISLRNRRGSLRSQLVITSNDPNKRYVVLKIEGTVTCKLASNPTRLDLGTLGPGSRVQETIEIYTIEPESPFGIIKVWSDSTQLETELQTVKEGRTFRLCVHTTPMLPAGTWNARIFIRSDIQNEPDIVVPVSARVVSLPSGAGD